MKKKSRYLAIILAAGKGGRLKVDTPKPLYKFNKVSIIDHLINSISIFPNIDILTVVGYQKDKVIKHIKNRSSYVVQEEQKGTGDAVIKCIDNIKQYRNTFIFVGDTPFIGKREIERMIYRHEDFNADCTFLYSKFPFELPYGRLLFNQKNKLIKLVESSQLTKKEKNIRELFTSQYLFKSNLLLDTIAMLEKDKQTGEYNLTDIINIYIKQEYVLNPIIVQDYWKLMGINTLDDIEFLKTYTINEKE